MSAAVNESLSSDKNTPTESCIHWICHQNTKMKMWRLENVNIRSERTTSSIPLMTRLRDFILKVESFIQGLKSGWSGKVYCVVYIRVVYVI